MILLVGPSDDPVLLTVASLLVTRKEPYFLLDQEKIGNSIFLDEHGINCLDHAFHKIVNSLGYAEFSAVLNRIIEMPSHSMRDTQMTYLIYILDCILPNVINKPSEGRINFSKAYQLEFLKCNSLNIPKTGIIANASPLKIGDDIIYKSIGSTSSIVHEFPENNAKKITCPMLLQKKIIGDNIRVHIVGKNTFAIKIQSKEIDSRYDTHSVMQEFFALPCEIQEECIAIAKQNNLVLSGIDLIKTPDNRYYFLEINPGPAYTEFDIDNMPARITESLVSALLYGTNS